MMPASGTNGTIWKALVGILVSIAVFFAGRYSDLVVADIARQRTQTDAVAATNERALDSLSRRVEAHVDGPGHPGTVARLGLIERRLERIEDKLDRALSAK